MLTVANSPTSLSAGFHAANNGLPLAQALGPDGLATTLPELSAWCDALKSADMTPKLGNARCDRTSGTRAVSQAHLLHAGWRGQLRQDNDRTAPVSGRASSGSVAAGRFAA